ncbi:hypothetical protein [Chryseobacterium luquanense]|uniref:Uncharacterized protein n=1 Tax=Chryseobacterium luquanense TaxID=2983766 RepID=A0ABT3Y2N7_9FLAO|nr:hypothetical protein [Chryseobacterium luquanense]MCX8532404.1 hypothetical protein [Chryseobacterium luquanense]
MKPKKVPGIPSQVKGGFHDTESIHKIHNNQEIDSKFDILKEKFFDINKWGDYCKQGSIEFTLCDSSGNVVHRIPQIGDYIKILLAKISNPKIEDYQWVQIDMIDKSNPDRLMIQCRPSKLPGNNFAGKTIHFYAAGSSSTFVISKGKDYIKMAIYGRNESPNKNTDFLSSIKNSFIALGGMAGSSKIQWQCLADGLIGEK